MTSGNYLSRRLNVKQRAEKLKIRIVPQNTQKAQVPLGKKAGHGAERQEYQLRVCLKNSQMGKSTVIIRDFNTSFSIIDRKSRQKSVRT